MLLWLAVFFSCRLKPSFISSLDANVCSFFLFFILVVALRYFFLFFGILVCTLCLPMSEKRHTRKKKPLFAYKATLSRSWRGTATYSHTTLVRAGIEGRRKRMSERESNNNEPSRVWCSIRRMVCVLCFWGFSFSFSGREAQIAKLCNRTKRYVYMC